ncbi:MAG TPA: hypothetical protein VM364_05665 [Vicinamibacterales bacterium]|nr:hypothetical protein [Vicinamibacterales bacterium]
MLGRDRELSDVFARALAERGFSMMYYLRFVICAAARQRPLAGHRPHGEPPGLARVIYRLRVSARMARPGRDRDLAVLHHQLAADHHIRNPGRANAGIRPWRDRSPSRDRRS